MVAKKHSQQASDKRNQSSHSSGKQGFASMDPQKQREIASKGGKASHGGHTQSQHSKSHKKG